MAEKFRRIVVRIDPEKKSFNLGHLAMDIAKFPGRLTGPLHVPGLPGLAQEPEFSAKLFRQLLSDKKARILYCLRHEKPSSLYALAKALGRDFKAVRQDIRILEAFGLVTLVKEGGKRKKLRPVLASRRLEIGLEI